MSRDELRALREANEAYQKKDNDTGKWLLIALIVAAYWALLLL